MKLQSSTNEMAVHTLDQGKAEKVGKVDYGEIPAV